MKTYFITKFQIGDEIIIPMLSEYRPYQIESVQVVAEFYTKSPVLCYVMTAGFRVRVSTVDEKAFLSDA